MQVTEILIAEHKTILQVLEKLEALFSNARYGLNIDEITTYINFFQEYADNFHHSKEEKIYFVWMKNKNPELEHGPLICMESEHEQGRILLRNASACLVNYSNNKDASELVEMKKYLIAFSQMLNNHIVKENEILYLMAEALNAPLLDGDAMMLEQFNEVEAQNSKLLSQYRYLGV